MPPLLSGLKMKIVSSPPRQASQNGLIVIHPAAHTAFLFGCGDLAYNGSGWPASATATAYDNRLNSQVSEVCLRKRLFSAGSPGIIGSGQARSSSTPICEKSCSLTTLRYGESEMSLNPQTMNRQSRGLKAHVYCAMAWRRMITVMPRYHGGWGMKHQ